MKRLLLFPKSVNRNLELWRINFIMKGCLYLLTCLLYHVANAQSIRINGPAGSESFGLSVTVLTNGNYVVTDVLHNIPGVTHVGAVHLYHGKTHTLISTITGSQPSDQVGSGGVTALTNGNFVISSPQWRNGGYHQAGAATWGNGVTGISGVISTLNSLTGSTPNDNVSSSGVRALLNGHYVVVSPHWEHNTLLMNDAGAVTWGNGNTGTSGTVTESNSIVGSRWDDAVGGDGITILSNNNYVITSTKWGGSTPTTSLGAVTWANGSGGTAGRVSATNSLVGSFDGDNVGSSGVKALPNGNYLVSSPLSRQGGIAEAGAVTWGNGTTGTSGTVNASNSLVGSKAQDKVGYSITGGIVILSNDHYVVRSEVWDNGSIVNAGAVTWCNGLTGRTGAVSSANSLVGSTNEDQLGGGPLEGKVVPLSNGNYVVSGPGWDNGAVLNAGAVIWCNGSTGSTGTVTAAASIIGAQANDQIGQKITALTNGNYVISSPYWDNGGTSNVGATTWANGSSLTAGTISSANSIIGNTTNDFISQKVIALTNGNYVVANQYWNNGATVDAGAATWRNGTVPTSGTLSASNSLTGSSPSDNVGRDVVRLHNGNYVVGSPIWNNGAVADVGAVTWGDGLTGITGLVSVANSLVGSSPNDNIGVQATTGVDVGIHPLANGNYVVESHLWNNGVIEHVGAVTLCDGVKGTIGAVNSSNSLVGNTANDNLGYYFTSPLNDGNYLIRGVNWDNGATPNAGSMTLGNGSFAMSGTISRCNSILGNVANEGGSLKPAYNYTYGYLIVGLSRENSIIIHNATGQDLPTSGAETSVIVLGNNKIPFLTDGGCNIVVSITPNGSDPVRGKVHAQIWKEGTVPSTAIYPYVARHYQITPEKNTSTARVTLYFTHKEFLEFNSHSGSTLDLPANGGDATGILNLRVEKFAGKSNDGTGLPASYTEGSETINPDDADIIWNSQQDRWEVSFDVSTGFSGFIVHTYSSSLPVRLVEFNGKTQELNALLQWEIADASNFSHFDLERSTDAKQFQFVSKVDFSAKENKYEYNDLKASNFVNSQNQIYYRLKMLDLDGSFAYSKIVSLKFNDSAQKFAYPNPFVNEVSISVKNQNDQKAEIQFIDSKGSVVFDRNVIVTDNKIDLTDLNIPAGAYVIRITSGSETVNIKAVKGN
ncbi:T9SS type A sorting domain-containing protein [Dyadobacter sp. CY312]|uniref:T9SS type A sorting domain-containing protein n=1 Tax=Dyadobacter sp. CY312 TaxID=2907303 RepID=UPI001F24195A|nr:T9SS type A sorting domain-containing protein [Dyadobacter sp. CY312]MCE7040022.1 T9SS type A sorting domain-containing protein [Dyadobacter sp. CY312]